MLEVDTDSTEGGEVSNGERGPLLVHKYNLNKMMNDKKRERDEERVKREVKRR